MGGPGLTGCGSPWRRGLAYDFLLRAELVGPGEWRVGPVGLENWQTALSENAFMRAHPGLLLIGLACLAGCGAEGSSGTAANSERHAPVQKPADSTPQERASRAAEAPDPEAPETPDPNLEPPVLAGPGILERTAEPLWRPTYPRPQLDDELLRRAGLMRYPAATVDFVTDLTEDVAAPLATLPGAVLPTLEAYFGQLSPARDGSEYRINAFLMRDRELFAAAGLVPSRVPLTFHGQHIGAQFWMNDQTSDYYRRHLLIHETTHAFMRHLPGPALELPLWYLEGMAELIATHEFDAAGRPHFAVMPRDRDRFPGLERIVIVQRDTAANGVRTIAQITSLQAADFGDVESYAWSWALCRFLDSHPKYRILFRAAALRLTSIALDDALAPLLERDRANVETEWLQFAAGIEHGYDFERTVLDFPDAAWPATGTALTAAARAEINADRGWQMTGIRVEAGREYPVTATGQFTLADQPKPWLSEANGISLRYVRGRPIGQLLAGVLSDVASERASSLLTVSPLGNEAVFKPRFTGTLYLRVNDAFSELAGNSGRLRVNFGPVR